MIIKLPGNISETEFVNLLAGKNIACVSFGKNLVRFVTHIDFTDDDLEYFEKEIKNLKL